MMGGVKILENVEARDRKATLVAFETLDDLFAAGFTRDEYNMSIAFVEDLWESYHIEAELLLRADVDIWSLNGFAYVWGPKGEGEMTSKKKGSAKLTATVDVLDEVVMMMKGKRDPYPMDQFDDGWNAALDCMSRLLTKKIMEA